MLQTSWQQCHRTLDSLSVDLGKDTPPNCGPTAQNKLNAPAKVGSVDGQVTKKLVAISGAAVASIELEDNNVYLLEKDDSNGKFYFVPCKKD